MPDVSERPAILTDEMLTFLDNLRESGVVNMFGAGQYLRDEFPMTAQEARACVLYWMHTFGAETR